VPEYTPKKKTCTRCRHIKLLEEFPVDRVASGGYRSRCKLCVAASRKVSVKVINREEELSTITNWLMEAQTYDDLFAAARMINEIGFTDRKRIALWEIYTDNIPRIAGWSPPPEGYENAYNPATTLRRSA
jgi:hypothetical protein